MAVPTVYRSTDAGPGTPILTGQVGSLLTLLDACLVNGYTGKPAAGWTKPFANAANIGCYQGAGTNPKLSVNDAAVNATSGAREAQARGFETLTSVSAGTGPFPTVAQIAASGLVIRKSRSADGTAVAWLLIADDRTFHLFVDTPDYTGYGGFSFGEIYSYKGGDTLKQLIVGKPTAGQVLANDSDDALQALFGDTVAAGTLAGHYMPRGPVGDLQSAVQVGKQVDGVLGLNQLLVSTNRLGNGMVTYPNITSGGALVNPVKVHDSLGGTLNLRGRMRGFWGWLHPAGVDGVPDGFTFAGQGDVVGRNFLVIRPIARGDGIYVVETTAWDTSA